MFEKLLTHISAKADTNTKEQTGADGNQEGMGTVLLETTGGNTVLFLHDEADSHLWYELAPHIDLVTLHFPNLFTWKYYCYRHATKSGEGKYEAFLSDLEQACLFLPCTSVTFLTSFWRDLQKDARLLPLLASVSVQPIPFKAAHGVSQSLLLKPLAAYPQGCERDQACVEVIAALEQKLLLHTRRQASMYTPAVLLSETVSR